MTSDEPRTKRWQQLLDVFVVIFLLLTAGFGGYALAHILDTKESNPQVCEKIEPQVIYKNVTQYVPINPGQVYSPRHRVLMDDIKRNRDGLIIASDSLLYTNGNIGSLSMYPILTPDSTSILMNATGRGDLKLGDIIVYERADGKYIIHRIVATSSDEQGIGYTLKGDNNPANDADLVRPEQIRYVLVGVVY